MGLPALNLVIIGNAGCRRVAFFQNALTHCGLPAARLVTYADLLTRKTRLAEHLQPGCLVRIESAAENWETYKLLVANGIGPAKLEGYPYSTLSEISNWSFDRGWIGRPGQLYLGFRRLLESIEADLDATRARPMNSPEDIAILFDKSRCQNRLVQAGIPVPAVAKSVQSYDELRNQHGPEGRVMLKLAHGSGAAGCVALHWSGRRVRALTTVAKISSDGSVRLYCSKRPRYLLDEREIADIVNRLCIEKVHVEAWLPKAKLRGHPFDLRIVTIGGKPLHTVARIGNSPFTNLNLGNKRGGLDSVIEEIGQENWHTIRQTAAAVAAAFPGSFYLGVDALVGPDRCRHAVLEANAFGDLLPNLLINGEDTYMAEVRELVQELKQRRDVAVLAS
jgi:glutathione synthase/RimK-type ligase-like ATP-grasp enzyme